MSGMAETTDCFSAGDMADQAAKAFRDGAKSIQTWISTAERLPDDDITVLIVIEGSEELWFGYHDAGQWRYQNGHQISYAAVTHWIHLPELPHA